MKKYPCPVSKIKDVYPRCTTIIDACTNKGGGLVQWASNETANWIKKNYKIDCGAYHEYTVNDLQLTKARFHYKTVSEEALDVGSEVHGWIEKYLSSPDYPDVNYDHYYKDKSPEVFNAISAFLDWAEENNLKPIEIEKTVYGYNWAGTMDFYGLFNGKLYVIDWKSSKPRNKQTGKGIYPESRYQVAAYRSTVVDYEQDRYTDGSYARSLSEIRPEGCGVLRLDKETGMPDWNDTSKSYEQDLEVFNNMVTLYFSAHNNIRKKFNKHIKEVGKCT